jgi:hypothetical protein
MATKDLEVEHHAVTPQTDIGSWLWSNTNTPPPATGQLRSNTSNWSQSTILYISNTDSSSVDQTARLAVMNPGDQVHLQDAVDSTKYANYTVIDAPVAGSGFYTVDVTYVNGASSGPSNGATVTVQASAAAMPSPPVTHMYIDLTLQPNITEPVTADLMSLICDSLQTVTHLVNHCEMQANIDGVIVADGEDILPAMTGDLGPVPDPDWETVSG